MKKLFIPFLALVLSSCADIYTPKYGEYYNYVDFKPYLAEDFFLSTFQDVKFEYDVLGPVEVLIESGYRTTKEKRSEAEMKLVGTGGVQPMFGKKEDTSVIEKNTWCSADINQALANMVRISKEKGADGIVGFEVSRYTVKEAWVKGIAIKRK